MPNFSLLAHGRTPLYLTKMSAEITIASGKVRYPWFGPRFGRSYCSEVEIYEVRSKTADFVYKFKVCWRFYWLGQLGPHFTIQDDNPDKYGEKFAFTWVDKQGDVVEHVFPMNQRKKTLQDLDFYRDGYVHGFQIIVRGNESEKEKSANLGNLIASSFNVEEDSDVKVQCENGQIFHCHKYILAVQSDVFKIMFRWESFDGTITIDDFDGKVVKNMLEFMYKGTCCDWSLDDGIGMELMMAADKYNVQRLGMFCRHHVLTTMNVRNVHTRIEAAYLLNDSEMMKSAWKFAHRYRAELGSRTKKKKKKKKIVPHIVE